MKRDSINYLVVGGTVLAGFLLLLYVLFRLTGGAGERDVYHVYYERVGGIKAGTPVTYEGFRVGAVAAIHPERRPAGMQYRVDLRVRDGWQIPVDSIARIYSEGLLAETVINIEEGASVEFLSPGTELQGQAGVDLFAALATVADEVSGLTRDGVRPLLENLDHRINSLGDRRLANLVAADLMVRNADLHLQLEVRDFSRRLHANGGAAVRVELGLIAQPAGREPPLLVRRYMREVMASNGSPAAAVTAFDVALAEIYGELVQDLLQVTGESRQPTSP